MHRSNDRWCASNVRITSTITKNHRIQTYTKGSLGRAFTRNKRAGEPVHELFDLVYWY